MAGSAVEVNDATFQAEVLESQEPVMVDFWAPWCGPCKALAPVIEQVAVQNAGKVKVVKINVDESQRVSQTYRIQGIPTLMFFKGGQRVGELVGKHDQATIQRKLDEI
ncbi:MAG: thioredoxin [Armatimonadota bacterium]|nr:thioredoxin [Armatimonadota bacterium]